MLVETDSPDALISELRPHLPYNEMAVLRRSICAIAAVKDMNPRDLAEATASNAQSIFCVNKEC